VTDHTQHREARIETTHTDEATARRLARALRPDNTTEMETAANRRRVVTTIEREETGGLHATVDDYVVNLTAGARILASERSTSDMECANRETTERHRDNTTGDNNE
jgi:hypothetical protein